VGKAGSYAAGSTWHANFAIEAPLQSNPINKSVLFLIFRIMDNPIFPS